MNDEGECVTDLAYYHPFVEAGANEGAAYNPFDSSSTSTSGVPNNDAANFSIGKMLLNIKIKIILVLHKIDKYLRSIYKLYKFYKKKMQYKNVKIY